MDTHIFWDNIIKSGVVMSDDLGNIKSRISTLTLQGIGVEVEDKMVDMEKQGLINAGIVQCVNDVFLAIGRTLEHAKKSKTTSVDSFAELLNKQLILIKDNAHSKHQECLGGVSAYQDIVSSISKRIEDIQSKQKNDNIGTRPETHEELNKRRKSKK